MYTTAYDLSIIARYAMNNSKFREIVQTFSYTIPASSTHPTEDRTFTNSNLLLAKNHKDYYYEYATGIKTGFTDAAGDCLVASAKKNSLEFIAVILHAGTLENGLREKFLDCKTLFNFAFDNYTTHNSNLQGKNDKNTTNIFDNISSLIVPNENNENKISHFDVLRIIIFVIAILIIIISIKFLFFGKREKTYKRKKRKPRN